MSLFSSKQCIINKTIIRFGFSYMFNNQDHGNYYQLGEFGKCFVPLSTARIFLQRSCRGEGFDLFLPHCDIERGHRHLKKDLVSHRLYRKLRRILKRN